MDSNNSENFEPDFIRRHTFYKFNKIANILEIKLPNDKFIAGSKFHPTLSARLVRNISQVKDYQNYFGDKENYDAISHVLDFTPNMTHSLLMGRSDERDIHQELLTRRLREFGSSDIVLITYDDLLRKRENLLVQNTPYHVF